MFSHAYSPPPNICEILHMKNKLSNIHHAQVTDAKLEPRKGFVEGGAGAGPRGKVKKMALSYVLSSFWNTCKKKHGFPWLLNPSSFTDNKPIA